MRYSIGNYMMQWVTGPPRNNAQLREYLETIERAVRLDEREKVAQYLEQLKKKNSNEFDAYIDYLYDRTQDRPEQIKLNLE